MFPHTPSTQKLGNVHSATCTKITAMPSGTIFKFFSYLKNVITRSSIGTRGFSPGVKRSERDADHRVQLVQRLRLSGATLLLPTCPSRAHKHIYLFIKTHFFSDPLNVNASIYTKTVSAVDEWVSSLSWLQVHHVLCSGSSDKQNNNLTVIWGAREIIFWYVWTNKIWSMAWAIHEIWN